MGHFEMAIEPHLEPINQIALFEMLVDLFNGGVSVKIAVDQMVELQQKCNELFRHAWLQKILGHESASAKNLRRAMTAFQSL
jgi:hypothetical protein